MARLARFDRTTVRLEGGCSIQLSYGRGQKNITGGRAAAQARQFSSGMDWSAATCRRFPTPRHVASFQSADVSAHSKPYHYRQFSGVENSGGFRRAGFLKLRKFLALVWMA